MNILFFFFTYKHIYYSIFIFGAFIGKQKEKIHIDASRIGFYFPIIFFGILFLMFAGYIFITIDNFKIRFLILLLYVLSLYQIHSFISEILKEK